MSMTKFEQRRLDHYRKLKQQLDWLDTSITVLSTALTASNADQQALQFVLDILTVRRDKLFKKVETFKRHAELDKVMVDDNVFDNVFDSPRLSTIELAELYAIE